MVTDQVCKMEIDEVTATYSVDHDGEEYFFCSEGCLEEFKRRPMDYVKLDYPRPGKNGNRNV